ncbi:MAG: hypothetical protein J6R20_02130 [Clostridia bacterium]|nr:hypothetical protein [Clostridia bacterium]
MKSKIIKSISVCLAVMVLLGVFPFKVSNAFEEISQVRSFEDLNEEYDKFVYLGIEAYEENIDGKLSLTDYYVDAGDWIYYRLYIKSDLYIGISKLYTSFDNNFFDVRVCTEEPVIGPLGYERNNNVSAIVNPDHPMVKDNGTKQILSSTPATEDHLVRNFCRFDEYMLEGIDIVINQLTKDTLAGAKADVYTSDEWILEWKVQVREDLALGAKGKSQIYKEMFKYCTNADERSEAARHPGDIRIADSEESTPLLENAPTFTNTRPMHINYEVINDFIVDDAELEFTVGRNPYHDDYPHECRELIETERVEPSCGKAGYAIYRCDYCGDVTYETLPAKEHVAGDWEVKFRDPPFSTTEEVQKCDLCGVTLKTDKLAIDIFSPESAVLNVGDSIWLEAEVSGELPEGAKMIWTKDNGNFDFAEFSDDGKSCKITCLDDGTTVFSAGIVDLRGNVIIVDKQEFVAEEKVEEEIPDEETPEEETPDEETPEEEIPEEETPDEESFLQKLLALIKDFFNKISAFFTSLFSVFG